MKTLLVLIALTLAAGAVLVSTGAYNVSADDPHWPVVRWLLTTMRERAIATRAADLTPPNLDDPALIESGAGNYDSMCVSCHLSPGVGETELSAGLNPPPPAWNDLGAVDPRAAFWAVKHGIRMTGMPAWGMSMDDRYIWGMVAFIRQFPGMTEAQYDTLVMASPGHSHGGGETDIHAAGASASQPDAGFDDRPRSSFEPIDDPMAGHDGAAAHEADDDHGH